MSDRVDLRYLDRLRDIIFLQKFNIPDYILVHIAYYMDPLIFVRASKNGCASHVLFKGKKVYYVSDDGTIRLSKVGCKEDKDMWISQNICDQSNQSSVSDILKAWDLYRDCWVVTNCDNHRLLGYLSQCGEYDSVRPDELDMLKKSTAVAQVTTSNAVAQVTTNYGTESYAREYMKEHGYNFVVTCIWDLQPSFGYNSYLSDWSTNTGWFIGNAGVFSVLNGNLEKDIKKGSLNEILENVNREMYDRPHNGQYRDHYYIYGKTFDEMI